jgi:DNA-binding transcriptional MerR regulator
MLLKIGELATRIGLTVRILHHYDKIGLLKPSVRSEADYRLYDRADIAKLYRIQALRRLNLSLAEVVQIIQSEGDDLASVIRQQILALERQISQSIALRDQLQKLSSCVGSEAEPDLDSWLSTLEMLSVLDKYFSKEEAVLMLQDMGKRRDGKMDKLMRPIIKTVRSLMETGVPPSDLRAQEISRRWMQTMNQAMPDSRLLNNFSTMHKNEASLQAFTGIDPAMMDYVTRASIEVRYSIYRRHLSEEECRFFRDSFRKNAQVWIETFAALRQHLENARAPNDPAVQKTLMQWQAMNMDAWGHQVDVLKKVRMVHMQEPELSSGGGLTPELLAFAREGMQSLEQTIATKHKIPKGEKNENFR